MSRSPAKPPSSFEESAEHIGDVAARFRIWLHGRTSGERIPAERELAAHLQESRSVIRAVLTQVEGEGLVRSVSPRIRVVAAAHDDGAPVAVLTRMHSKPDMATASDGARAMVRQLFIGISDALNKQRMPMVTVAPVPSAGAQIRQLHDRPLRGWILAEEYALQEYERLVMQELSRRTTPIAALGDVLSEDEARRAVADLVYTDQDGGAVALTTWLHQHGCRRIARFDRHGQVSPVDEQTSNSLPIWRQRREAGFLRACKELGMQPGPMIWGAMAAGGDRSHAAFARQVRTTAGFLYEHLHARQRPDAIQVASDGPICEVAAACRLLGVEPGRDILITGYDHYARDTPEYRFFPFIPQATIDKDFRAVGHELVRLLIARADGFSGPPQRNIVPSKLVVGGVKA